MGLELARAYVRIRADSRGLRQDLGGVRKTVSDSLKGVGIVAAGVAGSISAITGSILGMGTSLAGEFEQTTIAFETMLGDADLAKKKLGELSAFAAKTPFTIPGVEKSARQLLAVGFGADDILPTLKNVGDVAAGIGRGQFGLERIILNLGQVRAQGKLTGRELRDFSILTVPLAAELAKVLGVNVDQIQELTRQGKISSANVEQAFRSMASAGGKFHNLMFKQNKTLFGQFSNFKDELIITAREFGKTLLPEAKAFLAIGIKIVTALRENISGMGRLTAHALMGATAFGGLSSAIIGATVALRLFGITWKAVAVGTGIGAAFVAIGAVVGVLMGKLSASTPIIKAFTKLWFDVRVAWIRLKQVAGIIFQSIGELIFQVFGVDMRTAFSSAETFIASFISAIGTFAVEFSEWALVIAENWEDLWDEFPNIMKVGISIVKDVFVNFIDFMNARLAFFFENMLDSFKIMGKQLPKLLKSIAKGNMEGVKELEENLKRDLAIALGQGLAKNNLPGMDDLFEMSNETKKLITALTGTDVFKNIFKRKDELERDRFLPPVEAQKPPSEGPPIKPAPAAVEALLKPGRYGFAEFGNKIQDALLKDDLDTQRNKFLEQMTKTQDEMLKEQKKMKKVGLDP